MAMKQLRTYKLRISWLSLLLLGASLTVTGQVSPSRAAQEGDAGPATRGRLELGRNVAGEFREGESHSYLIKLTAGQFMQVLVSKSSIRIAVRLVSVKESEKLLELNLPMKAEPERPLCWVARISGDYRLELTPSGQIGSPADYVIRLDELRAAVPDDDLRMSMQKEFEEARSFAAARKYEAAAGGFEHALQSARELQDKKREADALNGIGASFGSLNQYEKAIGYYEQAADIRRATKDRSAEGRVLNNIGVCFRHISQYEKALEYYERALEIARENGARGDESDVLHNFGTTYLELSQYDKAGRYLEDAMAIHHEVKDRLSEGRDWDSIGNTYEHLSQYDKAIHSYEQALAINREVKDTLTEGHTLGNLGITYFYLNQYEKAIEYYQQALALERQTKDLNGQNHSLENIGLVYEYLGQYQDAIVYYGKAVAMAREIGDRLGERSTLVSMGESYRFLGEYKKAITHLDLALALCREVKDRENEIAALGTLGQAYAGLNQYEEAINYQELAIATAREIKERRLEAAGLTALGDSLLGAENNEKAVDSYTQSLKLAREIKDRQTESEALAGLMEAWKDSNRPRLAIFYGKQAINCVQSIRSDIRSLTPDLQQSFLKGNEKPYHTLADLLISLGRLVEAEQVLGLLKEEEYFNFVRRDIQESSSLTKQADPTPDETQWEKRYREVEDRLVGLGAERGQLLAKRSLTQEENRRISQIEQDLAVGNAAFESFLNELAKHFGTQPEASARIEQLRDTQGIMEDLRELPKGTVAVYTLVGDDKYRAILVTPDVQKAYEYPIKAADLNRKVLDFRRLLQDPRLDPRPVAQELFKILVANMAKDLRQAKAKTVMWSLDGNLRYLPVAALYDGQYYLIERYALSVFTPASNARLKDRPDHTWTAAGFGVTKAYDGAPALPAVSGELSSIIEEKTGQGGILVGEIKLNSQFTEDVMRQTLLKHYSVVHIASHFRFQPGNETNSFLLLGDGNHLTLDELRNLPNLFGGVQLLTLSACNTGVGDTDADGKEVEGLGVLAQRKGAKAVVASLWSVVDVSTSLLMQEFYRSREFSATTKAGALRKAQLALLRGSVRSRNKNLYAHPYYWAPFFLMGNWL